VENPNSDADLASITVHPGGNRAILIEHPPSNQQCWTEVLRCMVDPGRMLPPWCGRRATHTPFLSAIERTRLLTIVRVHLVAPISGATIT
jgi:hypothetical protein